MIRLTVLYNLAPGADEDEFLRWRLSDHQAANAATPGILRTDFARIESAWPEGTPSPYRFMTIVEWPDRESFEKAFYDPAMQASMTNNLSKLANPVFMISEILTSS